MKAILVRGSVASFVLGAMLLVVPVGTALADTGGTCSTTAAGANCYDMESVIAGSTASGDPIDWQVNASLDATTGAASITVTYGFNSVLDCGDGHSDDLLFTGEASGSGVMAADARLTSATASAAVTGSERTFNGCTGTWTDGAAISHTVAMDITFSGRTQTSRSTVVIVNPDGSRTVQMTEDSIRRGAGTVTVDGTAAATQNAAIRHHVVTFR